MESRLFVALIVAACLPAPSLQTLTKNCPNGYRNEDVLVASEVSENAFFAGAGIGASYNFSITPDQNYVPYDTQLGNFFRDVATAASTGPAANIQVRYGFFANDYTVDNGFFWNTALTNPSVSTSGRRQAFGGNLLDGLNSILPKVTRPSKPTYLPVIYASQTLAGNRNQIVNVVQQFRNLGFNIYLFPVGSAISDPNKNALAAALRTALSRDVLLDGSSSETNINTLGQTLTDQLLQCATTAATTLTPPTTQTPDGLCRDCLITESSALIPNPARCDQYIHCYKVGEEIMSIIKQCPHGTLYDQSLHTCSHDYNVLNKDRAMTGCQWCSSGTQRHRYQDSCAAFLQCSRDVNNYITISASCCSPTEYFDGNNCVVDTNSPRCRRDVKHRHGSYCRTYYECDATTNLEQRCCNSGTGFNTTTRSCVTRSDCADVNCQSPPRYRTPCPFEAVGECAFRYTGGDYETQLCGIGTYYSSENCSCLNVNETKIAFCDDEKARSAPAVCNPDVIINFNEAQQKPWGFEEISGNHRYVDVSPPTNGPTFTTAETMVLDGVDDFAIVKFYANNDQAFKADTTFFRVDVKDDVTNGRINKEMFVLSNHPCTNTNSDAAGEPSVYITLNPNAREAKFGIRAANGEAMVSLFYDPASDNAWKQFTLRYDQVSGLMEAHMRTYDDSGVTIQEERGNGNTGGGTILTSSCGVKIGKGADNQPYFQGTVDNVYFYDDCPTDKPSPAVDRAPF